MPLFPSSDAGPRPGSFRELTPQECWVHLAQHRVGRLAYVEQDGPVILPLNYAVHDDMIWLRTASYNQMALHLAGQRAAFEIDQIDDLRHSGWSVLVRGRAERAPDPDPASRPESAPWAPGIRTMVFCLVPSQVTGRALAAPDEPAAAPGPVVS